MQAWLTVALILNAVVLAGLAVALLRLRRRLAALARRADALGAVDAPMPASAAGRSVITIEILNPLELATSRSSLAGTLGALTPELLKAIVNREATRIIRSELKARGVEADVQALRA